MSMSAVAFCTGDRFTKCILHITCSNSMAMTFCVIQFLVIRSENFAHATTAVLSWHVQNFVVITPLHFASEQYNIIEFESYMSTTCPWCDLVLLFPLTVPCPPPCLGTHHLTSPSTRLTAPSPHHLAWKHELACLLAATYEEPQIAVDFCWC